ncbi:MAG: hypothetical protein ASARMPREDX12_007608 [Alectoria sarmentosa]|nr:MAG: hypothetical protein ASARMPREDX12_007608 [Alectoria sarmentosa]
MASPQTIGPVNNTKTELPGLDIIITDRLVLRPLVHTDRDAIYTLRSNPQVATCFANQRPQTRAEFGVWLKQVMGNGKCVSHCVELRVSSQREGEKREAGEKEKIQNEEVKPDSVNEKQRENKVIGLLGAHEVPEIGYMFLPQYWGKGYATEALKAWMVWYWKTFPGGNEDRGYLKAMTRLGAVDSRNVLQKCGFTWRDKFQLELEQYEEERKQEATEGKKYLPVDVWIIEGPRLGRSSGASS